jgi:hypothetical protein
MGAMSREISQRYSADCFAESLVELYGEYAKRG